MDRVTSGSRNKRYLAYLICAEQRDDLGYLPTRRVKHLLLFEHRPDGLFHRMERLRGGDAISLGLVFGLAMCLRLWSIGESLWLDELHTAWVVAGTWNDIVPRAAMGNNGPLYFVPPYVLSHWFGMQEWSLRAPSVLAGLGLVVLTFLMTRQFTCSQALATLAAFLVAIDSNAIFFSVEARPYALVQFLGISHLWLFLRLVTWPDWQVEIPTKGAMEIHETSARARWRIWLLWIASGAIMFHLHVTAALIFPAELCAMAMIRYERVDRPKSRLNSILENSPWFRITLGLGLIALSTFPAWSLMQQVAARRENWEMFVPRQAMVAILAIFPFYFYVLVPAVVVLVRSSTARVGSKVSSKVSSKVGSKVSSEVSDRGSRRDLRDTALLVCAVWLTVPILLAWVSTEFDIARLFFRRYVIASSVALAPLTALVLAKGLRSPSRYSLGIGAMLVGLMALVTIGPLRFSPVGTPRMLLTHSAEDWRGAVARLREQDDGSKSQLVILYSGLIESDAWHVATDPLRRSYCEFPLRGIYDVGAAVDVLSLPRTKPVTLTVAQKQALRERRTASLLIRGNAATRDRVVGELQIALGVDFVFDVVSSHGNLQLTQITAR